MRRSPAGAIRVRRRSATTPTTSPTAPPNPDHQGSSPAAPITGGTPAGPTEPPSKPTATTQPDSSGNSQADNAANAPAPNTPAAAPGPANSPAPAGPSANPPANSPANTPTSKPAEAPSPPKRASAPRDTARPAEQNPEPKERIRYVQVTPSPAEDWHDQAITTAKLVAVIALLAFLLQLVVNRTIQDVSRRYHVRKYSQYALGVILLMGLAGTWVQGFREMGVVLGMMSAGIGFALQEVIGSFAGWLSILAGRSISVGDRVEMGGIKGDVIDIGVLRTSLMEVGAWMTGEHYTGRIVLVSNAAIFKEPLFNYTKDFNILWDEIKFTLPLTADWRQARILMEEAGRERVQEFVERGREAVKRMGERYLFEFQMVEPNTVIAPGVGQLSGTVDVILRYTTDPRQRRRIKDDIIGAIMERFATEGINPGVPVTTFQMASADGEPSSTTGPVPTHSDGA